MSISGTPGDVDDHHARPPLADRVEQAVVELLRPLEVDGADHRHHQPPARELQHRRRELEDRLRLRALELHERPAQLLVGLAEADPARLELAAADLERVGHRVERPGERPDLSGAGLRGAGARARPRRGAPPRGADVAHGGDDHAQEVGEGQRDGREQQQEGDDADDPGAARGVAGLVLELVDARQLGGDHRVEAAADRVEAGLALEGGGQQLRPASGRGLPRPRRRRSPRRRAPPRRPRGRAPSPPGRRRRDASGRAGSGGSSRRARAARVQELVAVREQVAAQARLQVDGAALDAARGGARSSERASCAECRAGRRSTAAAPGTTR